jgi:hypothetical protein
MTWIEVHKMNIDHDSFRFDDIDAETIPWAFNANIAKELNVRLRAWLNSFIGWLEFVQIYPSRLSQA